ncbi:MAG: N-acetylmuramoyl-L-alanine amidase [Clostridia bacterium]|nr:N-acetylmuramoyl-L-alanine amidase [Clostridia bacterium]
MRKIISILTAFVLSLSLINVSAADDILLYLNDSEIKCDVPPVIVNDRVLVPARALFEPLGASLKWNDTIKQATVTLDDLTIKLKIGSDTATVNGEKVKMDCAPIIAESRTMFPVRFVAEKLGYIVKWDDKQRDVYISTPPKEPEKNKITSLNVSATADILTVSAIFSQPLAGYTDYYVSNPTRLVFELDDCRYYDKNLPVRAYGVSQLRMANHDDYFKLVFDMEDSLKYTVSQSITKQKLTIKISLPKAPKEEEEEDEKPLPDKEEEPVVPNKDSVPINGFDGKPIVVIDPGHGGSAPGAIAYNEDGSIYATEAEINLGIAKYVYDILKDEGIEVYMTRKTDKDVSLAERAAYANKLGATLFVSIHNNSHTDHSISGILTLYSADKDTASGGVQSSKDVAWAIQQQMVQAIGKNSQGIRSEDDLYVLRKTNMTAVLAEVLYMSNKEDVEYIKKEKNQLVAAKAIAKGIIKALKEG